MPHVIQNSKNNMYIILSSVTLVWLYRWGIGFIGGYIGGVTVFPSPCYMIEFFAYYYKT